MVLEKAVSIFVHHTTETQEKPDLEQIDNKIEKVTISKQLNLEV